MDFFFFRGAMSRTIRERQKECNTLVSLLTGMVGQRVTVELRNETKVTGNCFNAKLNRNNIFPKFAE